MNIAITGATGLLGRLVVSRLKDTIPSANIVAIVRSAAKASDLGVTAREADYSKAETLDRALAGIETLLLISSSELGQRVVHHRNVIEAAQRAGVKRIVYTSILHADSSPLLFAVEHRETEKDLKSSGIPYTILRNGWYTENYTNSIPGALAGGAFLGSAKDGRISSASRLDLAEAAVAVLTSEGHHRKTYELAGDESYTLTNLAAEIFRQTGKLIPYKDLPETEYAAVLTGFGLPAAYAQAIANSDTGASAGALFDDTRQLSALIGRPTTPMPVTVAETLQQAGLA